MINLVVRQTIIGINYGLADKEGHKLVDHKGHHTTCHHTSIMQEQLEKVDQKDKATQHSSTRDSSNGKDHPQRYEMGVLCTS